MGIISFCQTWMRGSVAGGAEFSVMSPHFQTRLYVKDDNLVMHALNIVRGADDPPAEKLLDNYRVVMCGLLTRMEGENYTKAFVHLDKLAAVMCLSLIHI